ncbi:hypothetical protein [Acidicapsa ligni]|uniref:hypothetical protein n=1 Tax=Acidicapsa ligni TaxID=542300 RepID=UPI0021DFD043|nr:hypothetical protein [Acidicapsa ligni]
MQTEENQPEEMQPAVPASATSAPTESRPTGPQSAELVASQAPIATAVNGLRYAAWGETRIAQPELERLVAAVPRGLVPALEKRCYYFVPLVIHEGNGDAEQTVVAPSYTIDLGDRAICHRNVTLPLTTGPLEGVFLSTRLVDDRFGLSFEFFINVAHNFVDAVGVPESFASLAWSQAQAAVRGETSQDAWETRRRALDPITNAEGVAMPTDERARKNFEESAFSDALAIYMLSLSLDFDYHDLREREYPLLAAPALAERLRHVASLFPANETYEFQILYRRKG